MSRVKTIFVTFVFLIGTFVLGTEINNRITTGPVIECDDEMMVLKVHTAYPFSGRVYVKGEYANPDCVSSYVNNPSALDASITVPYNKCNVKRLRMSSQGIQYTAVVVVSFHSVFETKVDRAYKINCVFQQVNNTFTAPSIEVSMIPTTELSQNVGHIQCLYEVRRGSIDGAQVRYALIGEAVYHVWKCETTNMRMLVRDCFVDDGQGNKVVTIDSSGCTTDKYVLQTPTYMGPDYTMVWTESHVFKYADRPQVVFQCQIHMCDTNDPDCQAKTPPICNGTQAPTVSPAPGGETARNRTLPPAPPVLTSVAPQGGQGPSGIFANMTNQTVPQLNATLQHPIELNQSAISPVGFPATRPSVPLNESGLFTNVTFHGPSETNISGFANVSENFPFSVHTLNLRNFTRIPSENETFTNVTFSRTSLENVTYLPTTIKETYTNFSFPSGYGSRPAAQPTKVSNPQQKPQTFANFSRHSLDMNEITTFTNLSSPIGPGGFANITGPGKQNKTFVDVFDSPSLSLDSRNLKSRRDSSSFRLFRRSLNDDSKHADNYVWDVLSNEITVLELDDEKSSTERKEAKEKSKMLSNLDVLQSFDDKERGKNSVCIPGYGVAITVGISAFSILLSATISVLMCSSRTQKNSMI